VANITVTTSSNFDDAANLALANGDNIAISSAAVLTINSDVRWGQNAAVVGDVDVTEGEFKIDASQTWWIPFDASSGNVPALGTCGTADVTRGGSNVGEFMGVWTALGVAPSAAGGAMPASGFVKLRSKSTTLADNDVLTFAGGATITINSATGGQRGWLHYVGEEGTNSTTGRVLAPTLGKITTRGDWFELGTGSGSSGQTLQYFVADYCPAIQVETASGSGVYEWWGLCPAADFSATNIATDDRGRFFTCSAAGVITFGGATYGKLPPSGAKIRCPNIHVSSSTSANWAANTLNSTAANRYSFQSTGGLLDLEYTAFSGSFGAIGSALLSAKYCTGFDATFNEGSVAASSSSSNNKEIYYEQCACSRLGVSAPHFSATYCQKVTFKNCCSFRSSGANSGTFGFNVTNSDQILIENPLLISNGTVTALDISYSTNVTITNPILVGVPSGTFGTITGVRGIKITGLKFDGKTAAAVANACQYLLSIVNCTDVLVDGASYWQSNVPPSFYIIWANSQSSQVRIRNIGSRATPLDVTGGRRLVYVQNCTRVMLNKLYQSAGNQSPDTAYLVSNCDELYVSDCGNASNYSDQAAFPVASNTTFYRRTATGGGKAYSSSPAAGSTATQFLSFGTHFQEQEVSATEIWLTVNCGTEKSSSEFSTVAYTDDVGTVKRDGSNGLLLRTLNDQVTWTWSYWILGITAFANTAPILNGTNTGNFTLQYDLDKGTGFSGTFQTLNATNLSAETGISPAGVKVRIRAICATANSANLIRAISIVGTTSASDVTNNLYPYNEPLVTLSGAQSGSLAAIFRDSDGKLLGVKAVTTPRLYPAWYADAACTLRVRKAGWTALELPFTLTEAGAAFPLNQVDSAISDSNPGALGITVTNHGASPVTWNSKQWSITVTVTDSSSAASIAQYLSWQTAQDAFNLITGFHNTAIPPMVILAGSDYETARGTLFGSAGAASKGVRVVDGSGNEVPGFARMQADDGSYYSPASSATMTVSGVVTGSDVVIYDASIPADGSGSNVLQTSDAIAGTSATYSYTYVPATVVDIGVFKNGYKPTFVRGVVLSASDATIPVSQPLDPSYVA
jgi:hypothetical protein